MRAAAGAFLAAEDDHDEGRVNSRAAPRHRCLEERMCDMTFLAGALPVLLTCPAIAGEARTSLGERRATLNDWVLRNGGDQFVPADIAGALDERIALEGRAVPRSRS